MDHAFSDARKTRVMIVGMVTFAIGFIFVAALPYTPDVSRGGDIFAAQ